MGVWDQFLFVWEAPVFRLRYAAAVESYAGRDTGFSSVPPPLLLLLLLLPSPLVLLPSPLPSLFPVGRAQGVKEMLTFFSKTFTKRTEPGQRQSITHEAYVVHCYVRSDGLAATCTTDLEYPARVAFVLLTQMLDDFEQSVGAEGWRNASVPESVTYPRIEEYLQRYQDPAAADKVTKIQQDLDETTSILHKTIDSVLERGVKLDSLVERSNDLSAQSKMFYKQAKKTNSCCVVS